MKINNKFLLDQKQLDQLEAILDTVDLHAVIDGLACVCSAKADHIRENWQDDELAGIWDENAVKLMRCASSTENPY